MTGTSLFWKCGGCLLVLLALSTVVAGQDWFCDYYQNVAVGTTYYLYSWFYPFWYWRPSNCRWQVTCPANMVCHLNCWDINMPASPGCVNDRLLVSKTGDPALTGADKYCGLGSLDLYSTSNKMSVGLIVPSNSSGGRFLCIMQAAAPPTPTTIAPPACTIPCGWKKTARIAGGTETLVNEYPMMVGLVDYILRIIYCGATIISDVWVLTAAHCLLGQTAANIGVLYGDHNITTGLDTTSAALINSSQIYSHPQAADYSNDIGLIRTAKQIVFSATVGPACLPFLLTKTDFSNADVVALGWGTTFFAGPDSNVLQKVTLQVVNETSCRSTLGAVITPSTICTYAAGKDACQHDSGGPLLWQSPTNSRVYLLGVIVGGYGCAVPGQPGINTRITSYLSWIVSTTGINTFCQY